MKPWSDPVVRQQVIDLYRDLSESAADAFDAAVERLMAEGPALGRPTVGEIDLSREDVEARELFGGRLKELRAGTVRVLFTFGPDRVPVLLYGGDKAGEWSRWYRGAIKGAVREYRAYLEDPTTD